MTHSTDTKKGGDNVDLKGIVWLAIILWCIIFWLGITIALVRW